MSNILFVNPTFIKDYSFVDPNVDEKYLRIAIKEAQELHVREYLGSGLYDQLVSQIDASTVSALNQTLLNTYVQPMLIYWTIYEAAPFLNLKITNKNISRKNSDNAGSVDLTELNRLIDEIHTKAKFYTKRMVKYLIQNSTSYPLYSNPGTSIDTIFPRATAYDCGIFFGNIERKDTENIPIIDRNGQESQGFAD
jgi:hypothetical protein